MKITVFTSNQPRHLHLIKKLSLIADEVHAVQECSTVFPGEVADFYSKTATMQRYFSHVIEAERVVFGPVGFLPKNVRTLSIKMGDLNRLSLNELSSALQSDVYVVFGASFIKGALCEKLVSSGAYNIHMGISPYYRGNSCNFWAMYDEKPEYVGATVHLLSAGLDSGPMLYHVTPKPCKVSAFEYGMHAVRAAHESLCEKISKKLISEIKPLKQDKTRQIRYTKNADFTDAVAEKYLEKMMNPDALFTKISGDHRELFYNLVRC